MFNALNFSTFLVLLLLMFTQQTIAQNTVLKGVVTEKTTNEPVPFVHVFFKGTQVGSTTNFDGKFTLQVSGKLPGDTLVFHCLGYKTQRIFVGSTRQFNVAFENDVVFIDEINVVAGENPAFVILDKIVANKAKNNPDNLDFYTSKEYSKIRFDLNNFTEKTKQSLLLRPFDYIWDNSDTTTDGTPYLPVLLVEKNFSHFYQKSPKKERSVLHAKKITGLPGPKIMEFVEDLYLSPNIYENYVPILDKNFPSPIIDNYKPHYYYLLDSAGAGKEKEYIISFRPKHTRDLAFTGDMQIDAESFAVKRISLRFDILANVNFVRSYLIVQAYKKQPGDVWMLDKSSVLGDFTVLENQTDLTGFFGRKTSYFSNFTINQPIAADSLKGTAILIEAENAEKFTPEYWQEIRPDTLTQKERRVEQMTERVENDQKYIIRKNLLVGVATGYVPLKKLDIGDLYTFYSHNRIENSRIKFGLRTSNRWDSPLSASGYVAYGFKDERLKFGGDAHVKLGKKEHFALGFSVKDDIFQLSRSHNALPLDHILTSLFQIGQGPSRMYTQDFSVYAQQQFFSGLVGRLGYFYQNISPTDTVTFRQITDAGLYANVPNYLAAGIELTLKYSWQNHNLSGAFYDKKDLKREFRAFPDIYFQYKNANEIFGAEVEFQKIKLGVSQYLRTKNVGYFLYRIEAGKTFRNVPYPFLDMPFANQLVLFDDLAFNLLHYMEFAADQYATVSLQHHFNGAILDRVPLLNKLKWRSFVFAKGYWGSLSAANNNRDFVLPKYISNVPNSGYYEVGFGLENIFKIARMDFVWRINDTSLPDSYRFIVKPSFTFQF